MKFDIGKFFSFKDIHKNENLYNYKKFNSMNNLNIINTNIDEEKRSKTINPHEISKTKENFIIILNNIIETLRNKCDTYEREMINNKKQITQLEQTLYNVKQEKDNMGNIIVSMEQKLENMNANEIKHDEDKKKYERKLQNLTKAFEIKEKEKQAFEESFELMQEEYIRATTILSENLESLRKQIINIENVKKTLNDSIQEKVASLNEANIANETLMLALDKERIEKSKLLKKIQNILTENKNLKDEINLQLSQKYIDVYEINPKREPNDISAFQNSYGENVCSSKTIVCVEVENTKENVDKKTIEHKRHVTKNTITQYHEPQFTDRVSSLNYGDCKTLANGHLVCKLEVKKFDAEFNTDLSLHDVENIIMENVKLKGTLEILEREANNILLDHVDEFIRRMKLKDKLASTEFDSKVKETEIKNLKKIILEKSEVEVASRKLKNKIEDVVAKNILLQSEVDKLKVDLNIVKNAIKSKNEENNVLKKSVKDLEERIKRLNETKLTLEQLLQNAKLELDESFNQYKIISKKHQDQICISNDNMRNKLLSEEKMKAFEFQLNQTSNENNQLKADNQMLEMKLSESEDLQRNLVQSNSQLNLTVVSLEDQLSKLKIQMEAERSNKNLSLESLKKYLNEVQLELTKSKHAELNRTESNLSATFSDVLHENLKKQLNDIKNKECELEESYIKLKEKESKIISKFDESLISINRIEEKTNNSVEKIKLNNDYLVFDHTLKERNKLRADLDSTTMQVQELLLIRSKDKAKRINLENKLKETEDKMKKLQEKLISTSKTINQNKQNYLKKFIKMKHQRNYLVQVKKNLEQKLLNEKKLLLQINEEVIFLKNELENVLQMSAIIKYYDAITLIPEREKDCLLQAHDIQPIQQDKNYENVGNEMNSNPSIKSKKIINKKSIKSKKFV